MSGTPPGYVHGRSEREAGRLHDQAAGLGSLLHAGVRYPPGSTVLEAGCGVGAQTLLLAENSPNAFFVATDISGESLALAEERVRNAGHVNVAFREADILSLPFPPGSFDHAFVCFTLEHIRHRPAALACIRRVLRDGGTITIIEGDHGTAVFHPDTAAAHHVIGCLEEVQRRAGGNARIGREIEHLLAAAGFTGISVQPIPVYASASIPGSAEAVRAIFIAMVEGVRDRAIGEGLTDPVRWDEGIRALTRTTEPGGMFCYTFFRAVAEKGGSGL